MIRLVFYDAVCFEKFISDNFDPKQLNAIKKIQLQYICISCYASIGKISKFSYDE